MESCEASLKSSGGKRPDFDTRDEYGQRINVQSDTWTAKDLCLDQERATSAKGIENRVAFLGEVVEEAAHCGWMELGGEAKEIVGELAIVAVSSEVKFPHRHSRPFGGASHPWPETGPGVIP